MAKEDENGQERIHAPSEKRKREAREKGQVAKSPEFSTAMLFFGICLIFTFYLPVTASKMQTVTAYYLGNLSSWDGTQESLLNIFAKSLVQLGQICGPFLFFFLIIGVLANIIQVGFNITPEPLIPKFSKIDPIKGFKNKFLSIRSLEQLLKSLVITFIMGLVAYRAIKREMPLFPPLQNADVAEIVDTIFKAVMVLLWDTLWIFLIIALVDFVFQRWQHLRDLMMTQQETKEESKQSEGDPQVKSRIRSIQYRTARSRMLRAVPKATVVITNPTHLAIALQYERGKMDAPLVVAKGAGKLAEKIKEIARASNVTIVENKPLARALFKAVEPGDYIPEELYQSVAEILAYVYRLKPSMHMS